LFLWVPQSLVARRIIGQLGEPFAPTHFVAYGSNLSLWWIWLPVSEAGVGVPGARILPLQVVGVDWVGHAETVLVVVFEYRGRYYRGQWWGKPSWLMWLTYSLALPQLFVLFRSETMPREIVIQPKQQRTDLERLARLLLETGADTGDDEVLELAVRIAYRENLDVVFRQEGVAAFITVTQAKSRLSNGMSLRQRLCD
jgi:hypothetical protein